MSRLSLRTQKAGWPFGFCSRTSREERRIRREFFGRLAELEPRRFLVSFPQPRALLGTRTLFSRRAKFFRNRLCNGFRSRSYKEKISAARRGRKRGLLQRFNLCVRTTPRCTSFPNGRAPNTFRNEFDVIGAFDVLEHIADDELVLSQMHQAVRKGGGIILTVPQHSFLWSEIDEYSRHVRRYSVSELKLKLSGRDSRR